MGILEIFGPLIVDRVAGIFSNPEQAVELVSQNPIESAIALLGAAILGFASKKMPGKRKKIVKFLKYIIWMIEFIVDLAPKAIRVMRGWVQKLEDKCPDGKKDV